MEERLRRTAKLVRSEPKPLDRVFMHDLVLDVEIGVYTHEKGVTQRVRFSVDVDVLPAAVAVDDDIDRAFDYDTIIKGIKQIVARGHHQSGRDPGRGGGGALPRASPRGLGQGDHREARQGAGRGRRRDRARQGERLTCRARSLRAPRRSGARRGPSAADRRQARRQRRPLGRACGLARCHRRARAFPSSSCREAARWPTRCAPASRGSASAMRPRTAWRCSPWISSPGPWPACGRASPWAPPKPSCAMRSRAAASRSGRLMP